MRVNSVGDAIDNLPNVRSTPHHRPTFSPRFHHATRSTAFVLVIQERLLMLEYWGLWNRRWCYSPFVDRRGRLWPFVDPGGGSSWPIVDGRGGRSSRFVMVVRREGSDV